MIIYACDDKSKHKRVNMTENKANIIGIGGIFFQSENPKETKKWYENNLIFLPC